jgi:signal transduction histidine kinase
MLALSQAEVWAYGAGGGGAAAAFGLGLAASAMTLRTTAPPLAVAVVALGLGETARYGDQPFSITSVLTFLIGFFSVGAMRNRRVSSVALVLALVLAAPATTPFTLNNYLGIALSSIVVPWLLGLLWLQRRGRRADRARQRRANAEAIAQGRLRLARELHDVVSHNVGMIAVQAGAADVLLEDDPALSRESLRAIENGARETLLELRRLLGLLREDDPDPRMRQSGLSALARFVGPMSAAGVQVRLSTTGDACHLGHEVELAAYRIVQEALTNAMAHAAPCRVDLGLRYRPGQLDIEIVDDGQARSGTTGAGYGLVGLRERVTALGGNFEAGPRPDGGFRVRALLPTGAA